MTYNEVLTAARGQMGPCKACHVCDGRACRNTVPGPGAKGVGDVAIRNYSAWQNVRAQLPHPGFCRAGGCHAAALRHQVHRPGVQ